MTSHARHDEQALRNAALIRLRVLIMLNGLFKHLSLLAIEFGEDISDCNFKSGQDSTTRQTRLLV